MVYALRNHWPMYIYELLGLAWVLLVAGIVAELVQQVVPATVLSGTLRLHQ